MAKIRLPSLQPPAPGQVADRRLRLVAARGGAELASMGAAIGAVYCAEKMTPSQLGGLKSFMAKYVIEPHMAQFDWLADKMPGFEGQEGVALRHRMNPHDRAQYFAEGLVNYSLMAGGAVIGQTAVQGLLDHMLGLHMSGTFWQGTKKMALATTVDRGAQLGSMLVLTAGLPEMSEKMQHSLAHNVLKKVGIKDDKSAEENARYLVTWQLPNLMGWAGSLGVLDKVYANEIKHAPPR